MFRSMIPLSFLLASCGQGQHRNHLPIEILSQNPPEVNGVNSLFFDKKDSILGVEIDLHGFRSEEEPGFLRPNG
jgi:hypothetical protein